MDDNAKPCTPKLESSDWRAEFTPHVRRQYLQRILDSLNKEVTSSSDPNNSFRMVKISQHLEQKAFRNATSKDDYVYIINGKIMRSIQNLRHHIAGASSSSSSNSDPTQTSMMVGAGQNSRLQNRPQVSRDIAGSSVRQGMQSDISVNSRREIPGNQSSQKVVYVQNQPQELQHQLLKQNHNHQQQQHIVSKPSQLQYSQSLKVVPESSKQHPVGVQSNVIDLQQPLRMSTTQSNDMNKQSHPHSGPSLQRVEDTSSKQNVQRTGLPLAIHQLPVSQKQSKQEAIHQRLELFSVSSQPQNVIDKQMQQLSHGTSAKVSSASVESTAPSEQANIAECDNQAYQKLQSMKEIYLPQLKDFYFTLDLMRQKTPEPEMAEKHSKKMSAVKKLIRFLFVGENDVVPKKMFEYYQEKILEAVRCFQLIKSPSVPQQAPLSRPPDGQSSRVSQLQQLGRRNLQFSSAHSTSTSKPCGSFPASSSMQQRIVSSQPQHHLQMLHPVTPCQVHFISPKISQDSSALVDQKASILSVSVGGEPLHSPLGSTLTTASTSASLPPFTTQTDHEIQTSSASPLSIPRNLGLTQTVVASTKVDTQKGVLNQPVAATSSEISTSCLPIKSTNPDGNQQSSSTKQPLKRLLDAVESLSPKTLSATVSEMGSVVNLIETLAGTASGYYRAPAGEDLTYGARRNLEGGKFRLQNVCSVNVSSSSLCKTNYPDQSAGEICDLSESTAASRLKRCRIEPINSLLDEIRYINRLMVETVIDLDPVQGTATLDAGEGTTVRCTFHTVAFNENFRMQYASEMLPLLSLRLLVAADYPNSSPKVLDVLNVGLSDNKEGATDLMAKTRLRFNRSLRQLSEPMSLAEMVKCWDVSASEVYREFAQQEGGECFSSKYGTWENCVTA